MFELIKRHTRTEDADLSVNLDHQYLRVDGRTLKNRSVYRIHFQDDTLFGNVLIKGQWHRYEFNPEKRHWTVAPKAPRAIPIEQLINRAEKNLRTLNRHELYRLKKHYRGHAHHWREFAIDLELTLRFQDPQPRGRQVCECANCRETFTCSSPSYLFKTGRSRCDTCGQNVRVRGVDRPNRGGR